MDTFDLLKEIGWSEELIKKTKEISELVRNGAITQRIETTKPLTMNPSGSASTIRLSPSDVSSGSNIFIK